MWRDVYRLICSLFYGYPHSHWTGTSINITLKLNLTPQNIYSILITDVRIADLCWAPYIPSTVSSKSYLRLLALSILICSPNMSFLARLVSENSRSLKMGHCPLSHPLNKKMHKVWVLVYSYMYLSVRFDLPSSINFKDINGSANWGPEPLLGITLQGPRWYTIRFYW